MTAICGWMAHDQTFASKGRQVVASMGRALRAHAGQQWGAWSVRGLDVGLLELAAENSVEVDYAPAATDDGRYHLWLAGEVFATDEVALVDNQSSRAYGFRQEVLKALLSRGDRVIRSLDGEYQIALWDSHDKCLTIYNDRFGGLPLYWGASAEGFAFAGGVRGVLMAPGISASPDRQAIREAVTFGGFRLGERTNVEDVKMMPGGTAAVVRHDGTTDFRRYWHWNDIPETPAASPLDVVAEMQVRWRRAIDRRLTGANRPGQTLSGGLDSRAILAEAAPRANKWTAITYGLNGCDDARYAQMAAAACDADWLFHPLYSGRNPDWLELRTSFIQCTDGLIDLTDLMHLESLPQQAGLIDVNLSGYIGDVVVGPTYNDIDNAGAILGQMPMYQTPVALDQSEAQCIRNVLEQQLAGAHPRFAIFENKFPQAINRSIAALRPWIRVRRPFVDYAFFDFCQGLPSHFRLAGRIREEWLKASYPKLFSQIPNQATGVPVLSSKLRWKSAQARRYSWRKAQSLLRKMGIHAPSRVRNYQADDLYWGHPRIRERIEGALLRSESLVCDIFGHEKVRQVSSAYFDRGQMPTQVVGAMYVYEKYHENLALHLANATH